jgi:hypothetical protein
MGNAMTTNKMKYLVIILMTTILFACSSPDRKTSNSENPVQVDKTVHEQETNGTFKHDYLKENGDSIEIPEFEILIELSDKAEERLASDNESIIVMAFFTGRPIDKIPAKYKDKLDVDGLYLRNYSVELTDKRTAIFKGVKFHKDLYNLLADKNIEILINVYSGRRASPDNILTCDLLQDNISNVAGKTFTLTGKLIGE